MHEGGKGGDTFSNNPNKEEIRRKNSEKHKGKKQSLETIAKKIKNTTGLKRSIKFCLKNSRKGKNHPMFGKRGKDNPNYGKHLSLETKLKISNSLKKFYRK